MFDAFTVLLLQHIIAYWSLMVFADDSMSGELLFPEFQQGQMARKRGKGRGQLLTVLPPL